MLQIANAFFKLPGDYLLPHEQEIPGFQARLSERLSPPLAAEHLIPQGEEGPYDWNVHDCVAQWWRPNFETFMYPFIPAHVTRPKECKKMYLIQLPKKSIPPWPLVLGPWLYCGLGDEWVC
jgi:cleavage and polyadenylation specificity factor subunit 5